MDNNQDWKKFLNEVHKNNERNLTYKNEFECESCKIQPDDPTMYLLVCEERTDEHTQIIPMFVYDDLSVAFEEMARLEPPTNSEIAEVSVISDSINDLQRTVEYVLKYNNETYKYQRTYYVQSILHK